jgi:hypothetical protein
MRAASSRQCVLAPHTPQLSSADGRCDARARAVAEGGGGGGGSTGVHTGAGGDHGIDHHQNWLRFPYVFIYLPGPVIPHPRTPRYHTREDLSKLPQTMALWKEALRLHPVAIGVLRQTGADVDLPKVGPSPPAPPPHRESVLVVGNSTHRSLRGAGGDHGIDHHPELTEISLGFHLFPVP